MVIPFTKIYGEPFLPKYVLLRERLKTFSMWKSVILMSIYDLASAGFIYTNDGDRMQCFACGHSLYNWSTQTDPLEEHELLLPECKFAKLQKHTPELIPELWDNDCLQSIVDIGYSTENVEKAYFKLLHRIKEKEKINSSMLLDELIYGDYDTAINIGEGACKYDQQISPMTPIFVNAKRKYVDVQQTHNNLKKIEEIKKENEELRTLYKCRLCPAKASAVFLPCGHLAVCLECKKKRKDKKR